MELVFDRHQIKNRGRGLTFSDVLLTPQRSEIRSRTEPSLETQATRTHRMQIPVFSANMDTITEAAMAIGIHRLGGIGILHRFMSIADQVGQVAQIKAAGVDPIAASIGVNQDYQERARALVTAGVKILTVDIAHGHSVAMLETIKWIKTEFPGVNVIAGNVATAAATKDLIDAGADAIKVGIGPGSMCTTRLITGCGVPQLTAIALCAEVAAQAQVPVIADGGIKTSGDIVKALAAGAQSVMLGSMLAGTIETPGEIRNGQKNYRGMASKAAQVSWRGGVPEGMAPEGESTSVAIKGHVSDVVKEICGGIRSGMSYLNAQSVSEISTQAQFIEISSAGFQESVAHGLR